MTSPRLRTYLRRFRAEESGSVTVEAMLMVPILVWCYIATFVFFEAFRANANNIKASYTIGDMLSREAGYVTPIYIDSLYRLQAMFVPDPRSRGLQVTAYRYISERNRYEVIWSQSRGSLSQLTTADLANYRPILPHSGDREVMILTRSMAVHQPTYDVGLNRRTLNEFTVTKARGAQLCWNPNENGSAATAVC